MDGFWCDFIMLFNILPLGLYKTFLPLDSAKRATVSVAPPPNNNTSGHFVVFVPNELVNNVQIDFVSLSFILSNISIAFFLFLFPLPVPFPILDLS